MKRQSKIVDSTEVVFVMEVRRRKRSYCTPGATRLDGKRLLRTAKFPSYGSAMAYVTMLKLGMPCRMEEFTGDRNFSNRFGAWEPVRIVRRIYRPGKGTVVLEQKLGDRL